MMPCEVQQVLVLSCGDSNVRSDFVLGQQVAHQIVTLMMPLVIANRHFK